MNTLISCKGCEYSWFYKGKALNFIKKGKGVYINCPMCHYGNKITEDG